MKISSFIKSRITRAAILEFDDLCRNVIVTSSDLRRREFFYSLIRRFVSVFINLIILSMIRSNIHFWLLSLKHRSFQRNWANYCREKRLQRDMTMFKSTLKLSSNALMFQMYQILISSSQSILKILFTYYT